MDTIKHISSLKHGLRGTLKIPGDKSISHRSVMFAGLGEGTVEIKNFLKGADCLSTISCMEAMGAKVEFTGEDMLRVTGTGLYGLKEPAGILNAGNSGTTLRLLLGLLAAQPFLATFTGDASLSKRPMGRVIAPLSQMGAEIVGRAENKFLPITVLPKKKKLRGISYESPVASAQVKSALLLAGLYADAPTTVIEPVLSRDHTERMMEAFGVKIEREGNRVIVYPAMTFQGPKEICVPGDISSAAYWLVAATLAEGSDFILENVGMNPTRTGILDVLTRMGAHIEILRTWESGGEAAADLRILSAKLKGVSFGAEIMPRLIDEIPILSVAALFAEGDTIITGAGELRVKETDRLQAIVDQLNRVAPNSAEEKEDTLILHGGQKLQTARCFSYDDHRMAMTLAVLGAVGEGIEIEHADCVDISYPTFYHTLESFSQNGRAE